MKEGKFNKWFCVSILILIYVVVAYLDYGNNLFFIGFVILIAVLINLPQSKFAPKKINKN